jgi:translocation and assembly module TamB
LQVFSFPDPPLADARFAVRVVTAEPLQLVSNLARGGARLDLHLGGTGKVPIPTGTISLTRSQLRLPSGVLEVPTGTATFTARDPFVPRLDLAGEARLRGYDVTLRVTGTLEAPEILLSSDPPLPNGDLTLLVLTGQLPGGTAQAAGESVAIFLALDFLSRWSASGWTKGGGDGWLERFRLVTGRDISERGVETTEATYRLREGLLTGHDTLYLVAERDTYEDYNFGLRLLFRFDTGEGGKP